MPGDLLDLILIALAAAFAVAGYRQGFTVGVLSFAGFLAGMAIGAIVAPRIAQAVVGEGTQQALVAIILVFVIAMTGQLLAALAGASVHAQLRWRPVAIVDAVGGAVLSVISVLLIAWLIGSPAANSPFPGVAGQVNRSAVLRGVDTFMPPAARTMFSDFRRLLASGPYPQVFGALGEEGTQNVAAPDPGVTKSAGLRHDARSIVMITGVAPSCTRQLEGSGFVIAPRRVLTNAHVVAGVTQRLSVSVIGRGTPLHAWVVLYDPQRDVAVLDVPKLRAPPLALLVRHAKTGSDAIVAGYPQNGGFTAVPARIARQRQAVGPNIYQTRTVTRQIYAVRAVVRPGNSGGPLLAPGGGVYGVVFAAAMGVPDTGYALTAAEILPDAQRGRTLTAGVSTQGCEPTHD